MNRLQGTLAICALAVLSVGAAKGESNKPVKRAKAPAIVYTGKSDVKVTDELLKRLQQFMLLRSVLLTAPYSCTYQAGGVCLVEVPIILVPDPGSGEMYCVGLFPEEISLSSTTTLNPEKTIVWSLIPPSPLPAGATFTFFDDKATVGKAPGVIVLRDSNKQLHDGALGDGTSNPPDPTKYQIKNKHKMLNKAVYIPVVVRTDNAGTASEKVSVCGTPDPRIAND